MFNVFHQSVGPILLISKGKKIMLGTEAIHFGLNARGKSIYDILISDISLFNLTMDWTARSIIARKSAPG